MLRLLRFALLFATLAALGPAADARAESADAAAPLLLAHSEEYCPKCPSQGQAASSVTEKDASSITEEDVRRLEQEKLEFIQEALLERILDEDWKFFETLTIDVLNAEGYEGTFYRTGGPEDKGIDGYLKKGPFPNDWIGVQMKRYKPGRRVTAEAIRAFCSSLGTKNEERGNVERGFFITTTSFTKGETKAARECFAANIDLIDGREFVLLMLKHGKGVHPPRVYRFYDLDEGYFDGLQPQPPEPGGQRTHPDDCERNETLNELGLGCDRSLELLHRRAGGPARR